MAERSNWEHCKTTASDKLISLATLHIDLLFCTTYICGTNRVFHKTFLNL